MTKSSPCPDTPKPWASATMKSVTSCTSPMTTIPACTWSISRTRGGQRDQAPGLRQRRLGPGCRARPALCLQLGLRRDRPDRPEEPAAAPALFPGRGPAAHVQHGLQSPSTASCTCRWALRRSTVPSGRRSAFSIRKAEGWKKCAPAGRRRNCCSSPAARLSWFSTTRTSSPRVTADGKFSILHPAGYVSRTRRWPPRRATSILAYGPHQSYWPVVYIWAARNGILGIDGQDLGTTMIAVSRGWPRGWC